ncbi:MAG: hypothetical protein E6700_03000 [Winkia neuii]|uniref:Leucine-binding protein domain-containing protein n=1 Tax=Winkia neuii TaxID=33007 RepID=A0A2I1ILG4_9ACTO|nr:hypothetical protein [Winkia neuii]OFJ70600.1 hypothetical protein HMPREF2851_10020 [Actinomyces sp. HMSC064C12]OFT54123.1 hypothetical protein HMPREF3152_09885 [Actinomyces sp. HMSC06A08]KWZ74741.1 hypothetical protein HMPREF3198_00378 [Winkia neuii]MDK8099412.1 hypothetical protein [Winkia neuii]MDU3134523.1 hypothetical protein [Winkia neuii]
MNKKVIAAVGVVIVLAALIAAAVVTSSKGTGHESATQPLEISLSNAPKKIKVGVIVSLTDDPRQGNGYRNAVQGVVVAKERLRAANTEVTLLSANDKGSQEGAKEAVDILKEQGAAAIIVGTSGAHAKYISRQAEKDGIAAIFPYGGSEPAAATSFSMVPDLAEEAKGVRKIIELAGLRQIVVVDAGEGDLGLKFRKVQAAGEADKVQVVHQLAQEAKAGHSIGAAVVVGDPLSQAELIAAFQGEKLNVPIVIPAVTANEAFESKLAEKGSLYANLYGVGIENVDMATLQGGAKGESAATFFTALNQYASDPQIKDSLGKEEFSKAAGRADGISHDGLIAVVAAAGKAGSVDPEDVAKSLNDLELSTEDGLVSGDMSVSNGQIQIADEPKPLVSTVQSPGVRENAPQRLYWFDLTEAQK